MDVAVVGGGIIGCAVAYYLQRAGASVTLIERGEIGGEASGAAAGMLIAPLEDAAKSPLSELQGASIRLYAHLLPEIEELSGIDVGYRVTGLLRTAFTEERAALLKELVRREPPGVRGLEWLEGRVLRELEPALSPRVIGAAYSPQDANLNPALLTRAFAQAARRLGAGVHERTVVTGFLRRGGVLRGLSVRQDGSRGGISDVDCVVLAAGPWTQALALRLGVRLATPPRRGQMLAYRSPALRHSVWGEDGYLVPKPDGTVHVGSTVEDVGFRRRTSARALAALRRMACALVPALRRSPVERSWAGLRPGSPDDLPIIGRLPGSENVWVASGHFRNGILLAPITGKLVSQLVLEGRSEIDLTRFGPERFTG
jgi:glycine oxidase